MDLVFATNNQYKLREVRKMLPQGISLLSLKDIGCSDELPETGSTLEANASQKARYVFEKYGRKCFADDTGLEVVALDGRPGVLSARYSGTSCNAEDNLKKLLLELKGESNRMARFKTVIALYLTEIPVLFEGIIQGSISESATGSGGFGYDPVFIPEGYSVSFAEMTPEQKNGMSHRFLAIQKFTGWLKDRNL